MDRNSQNSSFRNTELEVIRAQNTYRKHMADKAWLPPDLRSWLASFIPRIKRGTKAQVMTKPNVINISKKKLCG